MVQGQIWYKVRYGTRSDMVQGQIWYKARYGTRSDMVQGQIWYKARYGTRSDMGQPGDLRSVQGASELNLTLQVAIFWNKCVTNHMFIT